MRSIRASSRATSGPAGQHACHTLSHPGLQGSRPSTITHRLSSAHVQPSSTQLAPSHRSDHHACSSSSSPSSSSSSSNLEACEPTMQKAPAVVAAALAIALHAMLQLSYPMEASARARMTPDERVTIEVYKKATPSVVNVTNLTTRRDAFTTTMNESPQGQGSGFVFDKEGHVVTNFHVITEAKDVKVTLSDGNQYQAKVVGVDEQKDIAVLLLEPRAISDKNNLIRPLAVCDDDSPLQVGQKVFAIGNPFGLDQTLTVGVLSGTGREIQGISGRPIQDVIQTDAAINPGNSGGPLLDTSGCVIGINTAIYSPSGANTGVGFAIPGNVVRSSVQQIIAFGKVVRPALGIAFAPDQSSEQLGVRGIMVLNAREGGPAFKAGLQGTSRDEYGRLVLGDIITGINGKIIKKSSDLYKVLDRSKIGDTLDMEVLRASTTEHLMIILESGEA